jgi:hypothetical protein
MGPPLVGEEIKGFFVHEKKRRREGIKGYSVRVAYFAHERCG